MTILITGASGLIGQALLALHPAQRDIVCLGRRPVGGAAAWLPCDLSMPIDPTGLPTGVETVVYLAQSPHFRDFPAKADDIATVNLMNAQRLLDWGARHGVRRFIYASSGGVYGHGHQALHEDHPLPPQEQLGFYQTSKRCAEQFAECYAHLMHVIVLRIFFTYGPGQRPGMLIPRLVDSVGEGRPITLQGADGIHINPLYVDDAAAAIRSCLDLQSSTRINLAGPDVLSMRAIADEIGRALGRKPVFGSAPGEPQHLIGDITRMRSILHAPAVAFRDGIRRYLRSRGIAPASN